MSLFLRWWLIFTLTIVAAGFGFYTNLIQTIIKEDQSYLCLITMVMFLVVCIKCGIDSYGFVRCDKTKIINLHHYERCEEIGWFFSEAALTFGMLGTIVGFVMMLSGFKALDATNAKTVQDLLVGLGSSMSTALYTTVVGLVCGTILKCQYFNLSLGIQEHMEIANEKAKEVIHEN